MVIGFILYNWMKTVDDETRKKAFETVAEDLRTGGKIFGTHISKEVPLSKFKEALQESEKLSSEGKILINT